MSKVTLWICTLLLSAMVMVANWHKSLVQENYQLMHEGDKKIMEILCDRIDERDSIIYQMEMALHAQECFIESLLEIK